MAEVSPVIIKKTQDLLGKYVKKPPLTDKLLKKPPFRFLHDVINAVIQETGFLEGLYTIEELDSANVKEKDAKIEFLQKLIDVVKLSTNENLKVKPSKIIAGHEPERTNELLQAIGRAVSKKINSSVAIEAVKSGNLPQLVKESKVNNKNELKKQSSVSSDKSSKNKVKSDGQTKEPTRKTIEKVSKTQEKTKASVNKSDKEKPKKEVKEERVKTKSVSNSNVSKDNQDGVKKPVKKSMENETHSKKLENGSIVQNGIEENPTKIDLMGEPVTVVTNDKETAETKIEEKVDIKDAHKITDDVSKTKQSEINGLNKSNGILEESPKIPSSYSSELIDIIDQEAEIRRKEKSEKRSAKHKSRRKSIADETKDEDSKHDIDNGSAKENIVKDPIDVSLKEKSVEPINGIIREKSFIKQPDGSSRPRTSLRPPSVRPASARPGAPRRRDKNIEIVLQPEESVKMAGINVKVDSFNEDLDDDGENLIIIEDPTVHQDQLMMDLVKPKKPDEIVGGQQGHLVQQILETQKELSKIDGTATGESGDKRNESEWDSSNIHQRQSSAKQMDTLRDSIQKLTRSINPLGKLMDFLQEDIDSMQMELTMWQNVYKNTTDDLKREQGLTETAVEPLKHQLSQIESNIKEQIEMINTCRVNILQNDEKIFKIFNNL